MSATCWPWAHKWAAYKDIGKSEAAFDAIIQERRCTQCGAADRRIVRPRSGM